MFRHTIPIGRVLGIPIGLDYSWFLITVLITWLKSHTGDSINNQ